MKLLILLLLILLPQQILAGPFSKRESGPYVGFGFGYSGLHLKPASGKASDFKGWNGAVEGGYSFVSSNGFGLNLEGEYKLTEADNTRDDSTYMEKAKVSSKTAKIGLIYGAFTVGGGYSETDLKVKNVSSGSTGSTTTFEGNPILYFANYGFESGALRAVIEAQYSAGDLGDIRYNDYSLSLRVNFLLGN